MKKLASCLFLSLLILAGVTSADAQAGTPRFDEDPVEVLLDLRRDLGLHWSQVSSLRRIQEELWEKNRPLIERVLETQRQVRAELATEYSGFRRWELRPTDAHLAAIREPMEAIHANNIAAMERVNAILTESQKRRAAILIRMQNGHHDGRRTELPWRGIRGG